MTFHTRVGWTFVHLLPLLVIPILAGSGAQGQVPAAVGVFSYVALFIVLCVGQTMTVAHDRWFVFTAAGLIAAWLTGGVSIPLLDAFLHVPEHLAIPLAHGACGLVLGLIQSRALPSGRVRWFMASTAVWLAGAVVVFPFTENTTLPGNVRGLFPGSTEMTTLLRLLPFYGAGMLFAGRAR